jgi:GDP-L-fucose synthase
VRVEKLLFLGSSCAYPNLAPQPISEDSLLTGPLEPTNEWYAIAKIAGIRLCQAYRRQHRARFVSTMPTNLYGPNDNFDIEFGHVLLALMVKTHLAKRERQPSLEIWGSGTPRREFLHVDDLADAAVHLANVHETDVPINVGVGSDLSIVELAEEIKRAGGYDGAFTFNRDMPDGTPPEAARRVPSPCTRLASPHQPARRAQIDICVVLRTRSLHPTDGRRCVLRSI